MISNKIYNWVGDYIEMSYKELPYEPKSIFMLRNTCCMRCGKYYSKDELINSIILEEFWDYCSIKCALDDEIAFEAFFASLDNGDAEDEFPKNEKFYFDLTNAIKQYRNHINIEFYIKKAKKLKAKKILNILKTVM